jgi:DNA-directed RNA polymerase specialized sigma24 family protein
MNSTLDAYAIEHASLRARRLYAMVGFQPYEIEDVRQELLLDCLRRSSKFDPTRGEWDGFVRGVMRNHATVLIARRSRIVRHEVLADDLREPESGNSNDVLEIVSRCDPTSALHLSLDVQRVLRRLPVSLQGLAALLSDTPIHEICVMTGKSRSRIYQMIRQLRDAFVQAGLWPCRPPQSVVE